MGVVFSWVASVSNVHCANDTVFDEPGKLMLATVTPAEMLAALAAVTKRPGTAREPGVFQGWFSRLPTTQGLGKCDNFKPQPGWVGESEFVFAVVLESVLLVRHAVKTPRAQPISRMVLKGSG